MELLIGAAAVFGLLYLLGVEVATLLSIVQLLLTVLTALCTLFFVFCVLLLLFSQKRPAQLLGIEKTDYKNKSEDEQKPDAALAKFAFYQVDGERLRNWFPAETLMSKKIYEQKDCTVRIARLGKKRLVFDRHSVVIVVTGTILMSAATVMMTAYWLFALGVI